MFRLSNSYFSLTTGMIPPTKVIVEHFVFAEDGSFNKLFFWAMHRIRDSPNIPKSAIFYVFALYSNFEFSATTSSISSIEISIENTALVDKYSTKNHCFSPLHQYPGCPKIPKKKRFNFSRCSNSYFIRTTGFISSVRVSIEKFLDVENFSRVGL